MLGYAYYKSQKISPLLYILSIFAFINTVAYVIDAYTLGRNGILGILIGASIVLAFLGYYLNKELQHKAKKGSKDSHVFNKVLLGLTAAVILTFAVIGVMNIGVSIVTSYQDSVQRSILLPTAEQSLNCSYNYMSDKRNAQVISTIDFTNNFFLDRSIEMPHLMACFSQSQSAAEIQYKISYLENGKEVPSSEFMTQYGYSGLNAVTASPGQTKKVTTLISPYCSMNYYDGPRPVDGFTKPVPAAMPGTEQIDSDRLYIFELKRDEYKDCFQLFGERQPVKVLNIEG